VKKATIYIPKSSCKKIEFPNGGDLLRLSFHAESFQEFLAEQITSGEFVSEKGYLSINLKKRRTPSDWGDTHFAELDTWKSSEFQSKDSRSSKISDDDPIKPDLKSDDIPF